VPAALMSRAELVRRLREAFRTYGYEGATLARLSRATGLGRASLYHHFPGGKDEMAEAVLDDLAEWFDTAVFAALRTEVTPERGLQVAVTNLDDYYRGGEVGCLAASLALDASRPRFAPRIQRIFGRLIDELTDLGMRAGQEPAEARHRATNAVVSIEGALVVGRGTGHVGLFAATLRRVPDIVLGADRPVALAPEPCDAAVVDAAIDGFHLRLLADEQVATIFENTDLTRLKKHQRAFVSAALGGPEAYRGRNMAAAHAHLDVTDRMFDTVADHLIASLIDVGMPLQAVPMIRRALERVRLEVVTRRDASA
jgi:TetR/AcrR family transcriptional repressor of lmrAB and yxaGH operons